MKKIIFLLIMLPFSIVCWAQIISAEDRNEILNLLEKQRTAWNNGDLHGYMQGYWQSDSLRFVTKSGITYGWNETLSRYKIAYPTKEAMGNLVFEVLSLEKIAEGSALMIGRWNLSVKEKIISGSFSLIFRKIGAKWLIVVDHSS